MEIKQADQKIWKKLNQVFSLSYCNTLCVVTDSIGIC